MSCRLLKRRNSLTTIELLIVVVLIFVLIGVFAVYAGLTLKSARETALKSELMNLRMSIEHYRVINAKLPDDLNVLS